MKEAQLTRKILESLEEMEIIDCHEHLPPEAVRVSRKVDVFTLFSHYTRGDLARAGMSEKDINSLTDREIPLEKRWRIFEPFWERIRWTSYARAALLAAKKFYGVDDITVHTYQKLSERMQAANKPGLYEKVLRQNCRIKTVLTQCGSTHTGSGWLKPVMPMTYSMENPEDLLQPPFAPGCSCCTLDDYLKACHDYVIRVKKEGAVGLKLLCQPFGQPDRKGAASVFKKIISGKRKEVDQTGRWPTYTLAHELTSYVTDQLLTLAGKEKLVVAVHTGYWGDFRRLDPLHLIPLLQRHGEVRFDIYHCGYPWVRETLMLGKGFSNVWLNFCWTHIISQKFATDALKEAIELLPVNKVLAFGGDYRDPVEKVYGHLVMAREDVARVLAGSILAGRMNLEQALEVARQWFFNNPVSLYRLNFPEK